MTAKKKTAKPQPIASAAFGRALVGCRPDVLELAAASVTAKAIELRSRAAEANVYMRGVEAAFSVLPGAANPEVTIGRHYGEQALEAVTTSIDGAAFELEQLAALLSNVARETKR